MFEISNSVTSLVAPQAILLREAMQRVPMSKLKMTSLTDVQNDLVKSAQIKHFKWKRLMLVDMLITHTHCVSLWIMNNLIAILRVSKRKVRDSNLDCLSSGFS